VRRPIEYAPVASAVLFEWANVNQLARMWTQRTSAGQSLTAWLSVLVGLALFVAYYRHKGLTVPMLTTSGSVVLCGAVCATVAYFRWFA